VTIHFIHPDKRPLARKRVRRIAWKLSDRLAIKVGPHFGLTPQNQDVVVHLGVIYDIPEFNQRVRRAV
jgi:hypothetical protein